MEEDIKNLEELIQTSKEYEQYEGNKYYKSIENLMEGYKNLEKENKSLKEFTHSIFNDNVKNIEEGYKIKKKIKKIVKELDEKLKNPNVQNIDMKAYSYYLGRKESLEELLGEEE